MEWLHGPSEAIVYVRGDRLTSIRVVLTGLFLVGAGLLPSCQRPSSIPYPATIRPVAFLVERVAGSRLSQEMVHPGENPETYDPSVADLLQFRNCRSLFYVSPALDGWAANFRECSAHALLPPSEEDPVEDIFSKDHRYERGMQTGQGPNPGQAKSGKGEGGHGSHGHVHRPFSASYGEEGDPHFWTDPHRIVEILPRLQRLLIAADPASAPRIRQEIQVLRSQMEDMEKEAASRLAHLKGKRALLMHPTYYSFLTEHGLEVVGVVEPIPGREPSIRDWRELLSRKPVDLIVYEKQLPRRMAEVLSAELGAPIVELDPMGAEARNLTELLSNQLDALAELKF